MFNYLKVTVPTLSKEFEYAFFFSWYLATVGRGDHFLKKVKRNLDEYGE